MNSYDLIWLMCDSQAGLRRTRIGKDHVSKCHCVIWIEISTISII